MNQNRNALPDNKELPKGALKCLSVSIPEEGEERYCFIMDDGEKKYFGLSEIPNKKKEDK